MCFVGRCEDCGEVFPYRNTGSWSNATDVDRIEIGRRLVELATQPVDPDYFKCDNCRS